MSHSDLLYGRDRNGTTRTAVTPARRNAYDATGFSPTGRNPSEPEMQDLRYPRKRITAPARQRVVCDFGELERRLLAA